MVKRGRQGRLPHGYQWIFLIEFKEPQPLVFVNMRPTLLGIIGNILHRMEQLVAISDNAIKRFILPNCLLSPKLSLESVSGVGFPRVHNSLKGISFHRAYESMNMVIHYHVCKSR